MIAAGGDGTLSEVADGLINAAAEGQKAALGILPCGTGTDFARGIGLESDFATTIRRMAASQGRAIDAGRVSFVDDHGALASRHFINLASSGISGAVARAVNADARKGRVSAKALFYWHTVAEFIRYRFQDVRITVDDGEPIEARVGLVAAANGKFCGGGMMLAPDAVLDDRPVRRRDPARGRQARADLEHAPALWRQASQPSGDHHPARQEGHGRAARRRALARC